MKFNWIFFSKIIVLLFFSTTISAMVVEQNSVKKRKDPPDHAKSMICIGTENENDPSSFYFTGTPTKRRRVTQSWVSSFKNEQKSPPVETSPVIEEKISINAIYSWIIVSNHEELKIPAEELIDVRDFLPKDRKRYSEAEIFKALLQTEIVLLKWIQKDPQLIARTIYIGLSKNAKQRADEHKFDLLSKIFDFSKRKNLITKLAGAIGFNVRMRPIIHHVPEDKLPLFECLAARILSFYLFSGSSTIGNNEAWKSLQKYWKGDERKRVLKDLKLHAVVDNIVAEMFQLMLKYGETN